MINKDFKNQTKNECIHGSFNSRIKLGKSVFLSGLSKVLVHSCSQISVARSTFILPDTLLACLCFCLTVAVSRVFSG